MRNGRWLSALLFCVIGCAGSADDITQDEGTLASSSAALEATDNDDALGSEDVSAQAASAVFSCGLTNCKATCACLYNQCIADGEAKAECVAERKICWSDCDLGL